jgi:hypothetical protein
LQYEKRIIREFYQIRVERTGKKRYVTQSDLHQYIKYFTKTFNMMLNKQYSLDTAFRISVNLGAIICFKIVERNKSSEPYEDKSLEILYFVKNKQIKLSETSKILNEDKVKIYNDTLFYIVKSNLFKDWTEHQAIKDANEEIGLLISNLPDTHEN